MSSNYEVVQETDFVSRTVDLYSDGRAVRNNVKLAEREGSDFRPLEHRSLVHGSFLKYVNEAPLLSITEEEFNGLWESAKDKPWPPKG